MGTRRGITLHGREKLDEAGLGDKTDLIVLSNKQIHRLELDPKDLGISPAPISMLAGGEVKENAEILQAVLQGKGTKAQQDVVILNAALALYVGEKTSNNDYLKAFSDAVIIAKEALQSGEAWKKLEKLAEFGNR